MNLRGRKSPSGPRTELQISYFGATGVDGTAPGTYWLAIGLSGVIVDAPGAELFTSYYVPQRGILGTFQIQNSVLGADAVNITYQVRRNGVNIGSPVIIGNTTSGPIRVDLSTFGVSASDLISVKVTVPAFAGAPPTPKTVFTWFPE